jgi:D-ribulokinase
MAGGHAVGIDVGTSGVRAVALGPGGGAVAQASRRLPASRVEGASVTQEPEAWWRAAAQALAEVAARVPVAAVAVDGTSGTMLLADAEGRPLGPVRMYNDASGAPFAARVAEAAPAESGAHGATSPLAWLLANAEAARGAALALHQADWVAGRLLGRHGLSDDNNALKTGWDPVARAWPAWIEGLGVRRSLLPEVREPGSVLGPVDAGVADGLGLPRDCLVVAGTTDGCASFLATGASEVGDGVTALGSTLTLKLLSDRPVFDPGSGVYSHRLLGAWLAGGASNTGGAAIARHVPPQAMAALEARLDPDRPTGLDYHPLPGTGERFPVNDPAMESRHGPRPADDALFFQALLEGVAAVEAAGYRRLAELGAPPLRSVRTVGGGAANRAWARIRGRLLGVPTPEPLSLEAAHGAALLAARALAS